MPEFIFRTSHFNETGRFIKFDLAYRSDNATVLVCAEEKGIFSIEKAKVLWRDSGVNISSTYNISTQKRKAIATIDFFNWLEAYYTSKNQTSPLTLKERLLLTITEISSLSPNYPHSELYKLLPLIRQITHSKTILFKSKCCLFLFVCFYYFLKILLMHLLVIALFLHSLSHSIILFVLLNLDLNILVLLSLEVLCRL